MNKKLFFLIILNLSFTIFHSSIAFAIEVGGHLTEDTTWSPENNPYLVIENLYIDSGVTLTILPGTEIKVSGAPCTSWNDYDENFWLYGGDSIAKMFWIDGKIIAEGTSQDSITFTRMQNVFDYYWGCLYITEQSEMPIFKYCKFEYSAGIGIAVSNNALGAVSIRNGKGLLNNCTFINNGVGISAYYNLTRMIEVSKCQFSYNNNINNFIEGIWGGLHLSIYRPEINYKPALIVSNNFINDRAIVASSTYYADNHNDSCREILTCTAQNTQISYFYDNDFSNCETGIEGGDVGDSIYIKNNRFLGGYKGIDIDQAYVEISDNYFEGCDVYTEYVTGKLYNNITNNGEIWTPGEIEVFNNICFNNEGYGLKVGYNPYCVNNVSINNEYAIWSATVSYENSIIIGNEELTEHNINGNPSFRNCIIDFPLDPPLIDGGGNIWVDSVQAQTLFEDIQNGDFHLIEGSLAIDAGFDTLGYYYPFDMDYNHRVWDGDNNGTAIIDIGPYEFGAPSLGGIEGVTYNPTTGDPVDYVLLKINNQPGEFTFSDSIGNFEYKLPVGIYDVYAERVFYEDVIEYQIEVFDGEFTQIAIPMFEIVDVDENEIVFAYNDFNLMNYPNPFNPTTTISFSIPEENHVALSIYNIKGQKVSTLINEQMQKGEHSVLWSGVDALNKPVSSGIYLYKIKVGNQESIKRMLLLK
ncbi:MAG: T9SS type A sorting domain-containing protein [Candidatus Tenebribacter mawsonii]|nr:T9SS type A sorting domain-containing protein [Candidatus Tenebribacter mawsonii]